MLSAFPVPALLKMYSKSIVDNKFNSSDGDESVKWTKIKLKHKSDDREKIKKWNTYRTHAKQKKRKYFPDKHFIKATQKRHFSDSINTYYPA